MQINLDKHGVVEAHAGTGKTWTIVNGIVIPLIMGKGCRRLQLREICVVTYTEKAAEELKTRIYEGILAEQKRMVADRSDPDTLAHVESCLVSMHEAFIGTIHSICNRLLKEYPFEIGVPFAFDMTDDKEGLWMMLRKIIRDSWTTLGIDAENMGDANIGSLMETIIDVATACCNPDAVLHTGKDGAQDIEEAVRACKRRKSLSDAVVELVKANIGTLISCRMRVHELTEEHGRYLDKLIDSWRLVVDKGRIDSASEIMGKGRSPDALFNKFIKGKSTTGVHPLVIQACEAYRGVAASPEFIELNKNESSGDELTYALLVRTVPAVCALWREHKRVNKLMSFDDLLVTVRNAVVENETLRMLLRERIHFGIIDEFQDTSALQWEIFRTIFLDDSEKSGTRLYVVGDPKQSIYRFQNASIECYHAACTAVLNNRNSQPLIRLTTNYRSEASLIDSCNKIFLSEPESYFANEQIDYSSDNAVSPCQRPHNGAAGNIRPLVIVPVSGTTSVRIQSYAGTITRQVKLLHGTPVHLPDGVAEKEVVLDYHHFAVIAESHQLADAMLLHLVRSGIPAEKYKLEGLFESHMATEWRVLIDAISRRGNAYVKQSKALMTSFFEHSPETLDTDAELRTQGSAGLLFERWQKFSEKKMWARLFADIHSATGVNERLIQRLDGERRVSDLRQITDYSIEYLLSNGGVVEDLVEHLSHCAHGFTIPSRELSLHARENTRSKVLVMTIHASKGLEFPVCFVACGSSAHTPRSYMRWANVSNETGKKSITQHITPVSSSAFIKDSEWYKCAVQHAKTQEMQERRRLLYVALTRAKVALYVPMQFAGEPDSAQDYSSRKLPSNGADKDLTPILACLADASVNNEVRGIHVEEEKKQVDTEGLLASNDYCYPDGRDSAGIWQNAELAEMELSDQISELSLDKRIRLQMSYSVLVHDHHERLEDTGQNEEAILTGNEIQSLIDERASLVLPPGSNTGNALHELIEFVINNRFVQRLVTSDVPDREILSQAHECLEKNGLSSDDTTLFYLRGEELCSLARLALSNRHAVGGEGTLRIADIDETEMVPEAQFNAVNGMDRLIGFIDLVIRVPIDNGFFRYFIVDWKSTHLAEFSHKAINEDIVKSGYDRQAALYCHMLDRWLREIEGKRYLPELHLGGALFVYVRGLACSEQSSWYYKAQPAIDAATSNKMILDYTCYKRRALC